MPSPLLQDPVHRVAPPSGRRRLDPMGWVPLALAVFLYIGASFGPALFDQNEAQYAAAVREMLNRPGDYLDSTRGQLERGHWFVPTNDGIPRLQKPPFVYWALMGSMRIFGINEFAARLPNAVASLLWFAGTYLLGRRIGGEGLGRAGATILATMAGTFIFCHLIAPEPFLAAALTWTFWCFLKACEGPPDAARKWMFAAWILMAVGTGCKGLHGALYPLAVAGLLMWRRPETRPAFRQLLRPAGPVVFLAILVPWYLAVELRYPGFLKDQLFNEQLGHVFNRRFPPDSERVPFLVFCLEHLIFFLPWTFFVPAALRARQFVPDTGSARVGRDLLTLWFCVTIASLLFSSLQDYYLMSAWGAVALWLARASASDPARMPAWVRVAPGYCMTAIGLLALGGAVWLGSHGGGTSPVEAGNGVDPSVARDTLVGTVSGFAISDWARLLPLLWGTGGAFVVGGVGAIWFAAPRRWHMVLPIVACAMLVVLALAARGLNVLEDYFSLKRIALVANRAATRDARVFCAGDPSDNPSLLFYLDRTVYWVGADPSSEFASRELKIGTSLFLTEDEFARCWAAHAVPMFLIVERGRLDGWREKLTLSSTQSRPVATCGSRVMLSNGVQPH